MAVQYPNIGSTTRTTQSFEYIPSIGMYAINQGFQGNSPFDGYVYSQTYLASPTTQTVLLWGDNRHGGPTNFQFYTSKSFSVIFAMNPHNDLIYTYNPLTASSTYSWPRLFSNVFWNF